MRTVASFVAIIALATAASAATLDIDLTGVESWDGYQSPNNEIMDVDFGGPVSIIGIGWDNVQIETVSPSWLSEPVMDMPGDEDTGVALTIGAGDDFAGTATYSSGGIIYLADVALPDIILNDGILSIEFLEDYDDVADAIDAYFLAGTVTFEYVPEPAGLVLLGLGALVLRRR